MISVNNLSKQFKIRKKSDNFIKNLSSFIAQKYNIVDAVTDISFEIERDELVGFIGAYGAGRTTTMKMLSGLITPSSGDITVAGFTPAKRQQAFLKQISLIMGQKKSTVVEFGCSRADFRTDTQSCSVVSR